MSESRIKRLTAALVDESKERLIELLDKMERERDAALLRLDSAVAALQAIRNGIPGPALHAVDTLAEIGVLEVRCGNANCNALLSAAEPHVEGCLGRVVERRVSKDGEQSDNLDGARD